MRLYVARIGVLLVLISTTGCRQELGTSGTPQPGQEVRIVPVPEGSQYRSIAVAGGTIAWVEATAAGKEWDHVKAKDTARDAVRDAAARLAAVDYAALSLPAFVTYTQSMKLQRDDFSGQGVEADAFGEDAQGKKWALYRWQGPEVLQHPERPLVHRWVIVYCLYDVASGKIVQLLPSIWGEVHE